MARYLEDYDLAAHFGPLSARKQILFERRLNRIPPAQAGRDRVCDVGCADGQFLALARDRGWSCAGVELNPPAAARARSRGFDVTQGDLTRIDDLEWGAFDLVTCWDCLEHSAEPRGFAERLVRLAKPGATIMVTTLNLSCVAFRVFGTRWSMIQEDHFTYWNARALESLFGSLGCTVSECDTFGLGRDFVRWLDRIEPIRHRLAVGRRSRHGETGTTSRPAIAAWDVHRGVLAVERRLNRALAVTGTGVDLSCVMQRNRAMPPATCVVPTES